MTEIESSVADAKHQARTGKLLGPGHFCFPPKTTLSVIAYREAEAFSEQQLLNYLHNWSLKIHGQELVVAVQGKYDGCSCFLHRDKLGNFYVFTEDGSEVAHRVPHLIRLAESTFPETDYVLLGELEKWQRVDGKKVHLGREIVAGELHSAQPPSDRDYVWNFHDCIWFDGQDLHNQVYSTRFTMLEENFKIRQSVYSNPAPGFNLMPTEICHSDEEVLKVIRKLLRFPFLEGAMIKRWDGYQFELDGRTADMVKFKTYTEGHFWVVSRRLISGAEETFQYQVAIEILPAELEECDPQHVITFKDRRAMIVAKTFNTNVKARVGDVITVQFHNIFVTRNDDGKIRLSLYEPRVIENRTVANASELPDTLNTLIRIGRDSGLLVIKFDQGLIPFELVKQSSIFEQYPSEDATYKFIIHHHWRGRSVHADLRLEHVNRQYLIGYTLNIQLPYKGPEVTSTSQAELLARKLEWKFNVSTGVFLTRRIRGGQNRTTSVLVELKEPEPIEWLTFEGVTPPESVGATRNLPGVFFIAAKGTVEYGFRNGYYHEYFFHCDAWEGGGQRLVFRQLASNFGEKCFIPDFLQQIFDTEQPVTDFSVKRQVISCEFGEIVLPPELRVDSQLLKFILPPSESPEVRQPSIWLLIKSNSNEPFMLSDRAVREGRVTPYGVSGLPRNIRKQIPSRFRYWQHRDIKTAMKTREELVRALKSGELHIDYSQVFKSQPLDQPTVKGLEVPFILNRRSWRGPIVVRVGYSTTLYDLWFDLGERQYLFIFNRDPRELSAVGVLEIFKDPHLMQMQGEIPPNTPLNPNKKIPALIERLQEGKVLLLIDQPNLKKFQIKTKDWQGLFILEQDHSTNIWVLHETGNVGEES